MSQKLLVRRGGRDLTQYGVVDEAAARRLIGGGVALGGEDGAAPPLPAGIEAQVHDFEAFRASFWREVREHSDGYDLNLEDLPEGSPLEACYLLGKLAEPGGPLCAQAASRAASRGSSEPDFKLTVPGLGLSMYVQRLIDLERRAAAEQVAALRGRVAELEAKLAAGGAAV